MRFIADNWPELLTALIALAAFVISLLAWIDSRKRYNAMQVDLRAEHRPPMQGSYTIRNYGKLPIYMPQIDAAHLAGHRIDDDLFAGELLPNQPAHFRVSPDQNMDYPDGVKIQYRRSWKGDVETQYVRLPEPLQVWEPESGRWILRNEGG